MPESKNVKPNPLPMRLQFGEKPETKYVNNLDSIKVELLDYPSMENLMSYMPEFIRATWNEYPNFSKFLSDKERLTLVRDVFFNRTLPTAKENVNLVFCISGISIQEATHLTRYRKASFSADCSADKWWHRRAALVPYAIQNSPELYERFKNVVDEMKQLYVDMIDTRKISISDARMILPRCLDTFYYMRMDLNEAIHFITQRVDRQMQPETDNIISYQMYLELLKVYPFMNGLIDIDAKDMMYIRLGAEHGRMYLPEEKNDVFEWNIENYMYPYRRYEMNGTEGGENYCMKLFEFYKEAIEEQEKKNNEFLTEHYGITCEEMDKAKIRRRETEKTVW